MRLPLALDLESLYAHLLRPLMPYHPRNGERLQEHVERMEIIKAKKREIEMCEMRLRREKQFNRQVEINTELRSLKSQLEELIKT